DRPGLDHFVDGGDGFGDRCLTVPLVDVELIEVIGAQALEPVFDGSPQVLPAGAGVLGPLPYRHSSVRRQHAVITSVAHDLTEDPLRVAGGVEVGRVDEVHSTVEGLSELAPSVVRPNPCDPFEAAAGSEWDGAQGQS